MATIEELITKQLLLKGRLDKVIESGRKTSLNRRTQGFYESKLTDLRTLWTEYNQNDFEINKLSVADPKLGSQDYLVKDYYSEAEQKYSEYMGELIDGIRRCLPTPESSSNQSTSSPLHTTTIVRTDSQLPKISVPSFNGDYDLWRSFHDLFLSLVHNNSNLTSVQKLHYLKGCLTGDADKLLRHTPITNQDYEPAWNKLIERYNNKRILVNHQLKTLVNQSKLPTESVKSLKSLINTTEECLQQLKGLEVDTSSWDTLVIYLLVQKLPFATLKLWEEELGATASLPELQQLISFLNKRLKVLESIADTIVPKPTQQKPRETTQTYHALKQNKCSVCGGNHFIQKCPKYKGMNVARRLKLLKSANHCLNCLSTQHTIKECTSKFRCFICNAKHHTTIHEGQGKQPNPSTVNTTDSRHDCQATEKQAQNSFNTSERKTATSSQFTKTADDPTTTQSFVAREDYESLLATTIVMATTKHGQPQLLRCLVDTGSQSSFITEEAANRLRAEFIPTTVEVTGLNCNSSTASRQQVKLQLHTRNSTTPILEDNFLVLNKITNSLPTQPITQRNWYHLKGLKLADPNFWRPGTIDALLGVRIYRKIIRNGIRYGAEGTPVAINTVFGWILLGPTTDISTNLTTSLLATTADEDLNAQLKRFWETEEIPTKKILTRDEQQCEHSYERTHHRLKSGKYQVKLPFIDNQLLILGESRTQALKRFKSLEQRFQGNLQFQQEYTKCLNEYIDLGHMEKVDPPKNAERHYYIPHHAVFKESLTTKLRVVFDASAKTTNGRSLNQCLLTGPTLQSKLFDTLLNWRKYRIAMKADLEKMYRMIEVHPEHRTFQRIIWRNPTSLEVQDYQLTTVTFGTSSAPYLAIRTLQQLANDEQSNWPLAAKVARTEFYVDDLLTGADNLTQAKQLQHQLINMMKSGGFNLRKWASNDPRLLQDIPVEHRELQHTLLFSESDSVKTLGIRWHPGTDQFSFAITPRHEQTITTKRTILSEVASLYDPLGWLAPAIVVAKLLIQTLWMTGTSWDTQVTATIEANWKSFKEEMHTLSSLKIPRWAHFCPTARIQLHGFRDASARAYAAVVYLRVEDEHGNINTTLLTAKTKVAPLKPTTIPRLELCGALLLARLLKTTNETMQLQYTRTFAWTDAMIVLQWIKEHPSKWKTYVANRVVEIQEIIGHDHWQHISTKHNPADLASRGISTPNLVTNKLWWHGPDWLTKHESDWPKRTVSQEQTELEAKKPEIKALTTLSANSIVYKYSSYTRLIRVTATMQRFIYNCRYPSNKRTNTLSSADIRRAEVTILRLVQQVAFSEEYDQIRNKQIISRKSRLLSLNPFLDDSGLLRVGGRLQNAPLSFDRKHPIILPRDNHVTMLIVDKLHKETLHGGPSLVLNTSRNRYWILDGRRCITTRIHKCIACARYRNVIANQLMGNLPTPRINITNHSQKWELILPGP